jgi:superfamily II DNA helicase RecQ
VTTEQLFRSKEGHLSRLGALIRLPSFQRVIMYRIIDEVHETWFSGTPRYGVDAFREKWGCLREIKVILPSTIPTLAMTATCPPHILSVVKSAIGTPSFREIRTTVNRHNIMYSTHCVVGDVCTAGNYRCFVSDVFELNKQPRVLFFCDNKKHTFAICSAIESFLPSQFRGAGVVNHYHSGMSRRYLDRVHSEFTFEGGNCRFLVATSAEATVSIARIISIS